MSEKVEPASDALIENFRKFDYTDNDIQCLIARIDSLRAELSQCKQLKDADNAELKRVYAELTALAAGLSEEEKALREIIFAARSVQTFLWGEADGSWGLEEWRKMFLKRNQKLDAIDSSNPHAIIEFRKRILQNAALSVALLVIIDKKALSLPLPQAVQRVEAMERALRRIAKGTHEDHPTCMGLPNGEFGPPRTGGWEGWAREIAETHKQIAREALDEIGKVKS